MSADGGRIDFEWTIGEGGGCCGSASATKTVQRAMPAVLDGRFTLAQWNTFCDQLDEALMPLNKSAKKVGKGKITCVVYLVLFGLLFLSIELGWLYRPGFIIWRYIIFGMLIIIMLVQSYYSGNKVSRYTKESVDGIARVCQDTSLLYPEISFDVRHETMVVGWVTTSRLSVFYIDAYVSGVNYKSAAATSFVQAFPAPTAPGASLNLGTVKDTEAFPAPTDLGTSPLAQSSTTPAQRMKELDSMKSFLSESEYEAKRAEIMLSV